MANDAVKMEVEIQMGLIVRPGDRLIIALPERIVDAQTMDRYKAKIMERLPGLADVLVITGAAGVAVYREEGEDPHAWQEFNAHENTCHYPGCTRTEEEHTWTR